MRTIAGHRPRPPAPALGEQFAGEGYTHVPATHLRWLKVAATVAERNCTASPFRHGAVVVAGGRLLGRGYNRPRNDPAVHDDNLSVHAETDAMHGVAVRKLARATLYVARLTPAGWLALSAPCLACSTAAREAGIGRIVYTCDGGVGCLPM